MKVRHTPAGKGATDLILATFRLNGRLLAAGDQLARDLGLSSARWQVMGALADGPLPVAQIARNMGLTRQSVQRTVDVLAEEQLVTFTENPYHQRAKLVLLTERGTERLEEVTRRQATWVNQLAKELSPHELSAAVRLMDTVRQRLGKPAGKDKRYG